MMVPVENMPPKQLQPSSNCGESSRTGLNFANNFMFQPTQSTAINTHVNTMLHTQV